MCDAALGLLGAGGTWFWGGRDAPGLTYLKPQLPAALWSPWGSQDLCGSPLHPNACNLSSETPCPRPIAPSKLAFPRGTPHQNSSPPRPSESKTGGKAPNRIRLGTAVSPHHPAVPPLCSAFLCSANSSRLPAQTQLGSLGRFRGSPPSLVRPTCLSSFRAPGVTHLKHGFKTTCCHNSFNPSHSWGYLGADGLPGVVAPEKRGGVLSRALGVGLKLKAIPARGHGSGPCRRPVCAITEGSELVGEGSLLLEGPGTPHAQRRCVLVMGSGVGAEDRQGQGLGVAPLLPLPRPPGRGLLGDFWGRFRTHVGGNRLSLFHARLSM